MSGDTLKIGTNSAGQVVELKKSSAFPGGGTIYVDGKPQSQSQSMSHMLREFEKHTR